MVIVVYGKAFLCVKKVTFTGFGSKLKKCSRRHFYSFKIHDCKFSFYFMYNLHKYNYMLLQVKLWFTIWWKAAFLHAGFFTFQRKAWKLFFFLPLITCISNFHAVIIKEMLMICFQNNLELWFNIMWQMLWNPHKVWNRIGVLKLSLKI